MPLLALLAACQSKRDICARWYSGGELRNEEALEKLGLQRNSARTTHIGAQGTYESDEAYFKRQHRENKRADQEKLIAFCSFYGKR